MKRGGAVTLGVTCFMIGLLYSLRGQTIKIQSAPIPDSTFLEDQIEQYEESLDDEDHTFVPYSQVVQEEKSVQQNSSTLEKQGNLTDHSNQMRGIGHNNISKAGQDIGNLLKTVVREVLRTTVRFFDRVISES